MTGLPDSSSWAVGDIVAVRWMEETVFATVERVEQKRPFGRRYYWVAIPGVEHPASYGEHELKDPASCA